MTELEQEAIPVSLRFPVFSEAHKQAIQALQDNMKYKAELYRTATGLGSRKTIENSRASLLQAIRFADASLNNNVKW